MANGSQQLSYTLKVTYRNEDEMVAQIGDVRYPTFEMALAAVKSGETITLLKDVTCNNSAVASESSAAVYTLPSGANLDGGNHVITADSDSWVATEEEPANHILTIADGTSTISNLIIHGNKKVLSGIYAAGNAAILNLNKITVSGCGADGIQIAGAIATMTDVNTADNAAAIKVTKATVGDIPKVVFNSGVLAETVELYTDITDQNVITATGYTKVQGYGETLKGFVYYVSAVDKLNHCASAAGAIYETVSDAMKNPPAEGDITLLKDVDEDVVVPTGTTASLVGTTKETTIRGFIKCMAAGVGNTSLTLRNLVLDGQGVKDFGILSQNQTDTDQMELSLSMIAVTIKNYVAKGIYATNAKLMHMSGCTVQDCATGEMDEPNTRGDHAIDLNLIAVKNAIVNITNNYFKGILGKLSAVKVSQRGGESDKDAADMPHNVGEASVDNCIVTGIAMTDTDTPYLLIVGETHKSGDVGTNSTAAFKSIVMVTEGDPAVTIKSNVIAESNTLTVPTGRTATKTAADAMFSLVKTPDELIDDIFAGMDESMDIVDEGDNTFAITTADGTISNSGLFDQIAAVEGLKTIVVTDGADKTATYTAGGDLAAFKSEVDAMLPKDNLAETITLTMTVTF